MLLKRTSQGESAVANVVWEKERFFTSSYFFRAIHWASPHRAPQMAFALLTRDEHLAAFYKSFLAKRYRKSALEELEREKKKASKKPLAKAPTGSSLDALGRLLDERYCQLLPKGNARQDQDFVRRAIAKYKLTSCYVLAEHQHYDQQYVSVEVALEEIVSVGHTSLIFFVPGQVAYLEGHSPGERYLCLREGEASGASFVQ